MKNKIGRPSKKTPDVIGKLEQAFSLGSTVLTACFNAGIHPDTYYEWCKNDEDFSDRMAAMKEAPILKALNTVINDLDNVSTAKWYLERKRKDEFGTQPAMEDYEDNSQSIKIEIVDASK